MGEQTQTGKRLKVLLNTEGWKAVCLCSQCHFHMGLPVPTYLGYKILQPENDISSGKDTFYSLFPSFIFYLLLFYIWKFANKHKLYHRSQPNS